MSRRDQLMAKNANIRSTAEISDEEVLAAAQNHRPRSGQGSFSQRQRLEDRLKELEERLAGVESSAISMGSIEPNPWQPRRVFNAEDLQDLAMSIQEIGLIQPIVVRVSNRDTSGTENSAQDSVSIRDTQYQLIAGERRYRASQLLGHKEIKAVVLSVNDCDMSAYALAENIDRADLSAYEIAIAIKAAESNFPNRTNFAKSIGMPRSSLYKYLSFFKLPDYVINDLDQNPRILGRDAADALTSVILEHGEQAVENLRSLWPNIVLGKVDQGKAAEALLATLQTKASIQSDRDIRKIFLGKEHAGTITKDSASLTVKIKTAMLTPEIEAELRTVIDKLFNAN
jgi:ParB family chromosome partitioning protein